MLIDLDVDRVLRATAIIMPYVTLQEAHAIQRLRGQPAALIGKLFGISISAADAHDHAAAPSDVPRRTHVTQRKHPPNLHALADTESDRSALSHSFGRGHRDGSTVCPPRAALRHPPSCGLTLRY